VRRRPFDSTMRPRAEKRGRWRNVMRPLRFICVSLGVVGFFGGPGVRPASAQTAAQVQQQIDLVGEMISVVFEVFFALDPQRKRFRPKWIAPDAYDALRPGMAKQIKGSVDTERSAAAENYIRLHFRFIQ